MDREKIFQEAERLLQGAGYTVSRGLGVNLSLRPEADPCGTQCSGGCQAGCYTCQPGASNVPPKNLHPTFQLSTEGVLEELVTISEGPEK